MNQPSQTIDQIDQAHTTIEMYSLLQARAIAIRRHLQRRAKSPSRHAVGNDHARCDCGTGIAIRELQQMILQRLQCLPSLRPTI